MFGPTIPPVPLAEAERIGTQFAASAGAASLGALRALSTQEIVDAAKRAAGAFPTAIDGYFLTKPPADIFAAGSQAHVPLLAGSNSQELGARQLLGTDPPTLEGLEQAIRRQFTVGVDEVLSAYLPSKPDEVDQAATDLASDRFIAYSTWKWLEVHGRTGGSPVYYYYYSRPRPAMTAAMGNAVPGLAGGVTAATNTTGTRPAAREAPCTRRKSSTRWATSPPTRCSTGRRTISACPRLMQDYFANFIKAGNPNGSGLPAWEAANSGAGIKRMRIDVEPRLEPETRTLRYKALDKAYEK